MLSEIEPAQWSTPVIYVNPNYEIFVPYNYNPFKIQIIDFFNMKEDTKYNNDYFIISYVKDCNRKIGFFQIKELLRCIKQNCDYIPNIYKYELFKDIWNLDQ